MEKYFTAGQATDDNMAPARFMCTFILDNMILYEKKISILIVIANSGIRISIIRSYLCTINSIAGNNNNNRRKSYKILNTYINIIANM